MARERQQEKSHRSAPGVGLGKQIRVTLKTV